MVDTHYSAHPLINGMHQDLFTQDSFTPEEYTIKEAALCQASYFRQQKSRLDALLQKHQPGSGVQCYKKVYAIERILLFIRLL